MPRSEAIAGFTHADDRGRVSLSKPLRELGVEAGAPIAYVKVGDALVLVPQDAHLTQVMEAMLRVLEDARLTPDALLADLDAVRADVVEEHYGVEFMEALERAAMEQGARSDTP